MIVGIHEISQKNTGQRLHCLSLVFASSLMKLKKIQKVS